MRIWHTIIIVLFSFCALAEDCEFQAEVVPKERYETAKEVYQETCEWFYENFNQYPLLPLTKIEYVDFFEEMPDLGGSNVSADNTEGVYCCKRDVNMNEIYLNTHYFKDKEDIYNQSVLAHEVIHFIVNSANFERLLAVNSWENVGMHEALAYWGQSKFLERHSGRNLMDHLNISKEYPTALSDFDAMVNVFYGIRYEAFVYGSIHFFDTDTRNRYNKLIDNKFYNDITSSEVTAARRRMQQIKSEEAAE